MTAQHDSPMDRTKSLILVTFCDDCEGRINRNMQFAKPLFADLLAMEPATFKVAKPGRRSIAPWQFADLLVTLWHSWLSRNISISLPVKK